MGSGHDGRLMLDVEKGNDECVMRNMLCTRLRKEGAKIVLHGLALRFFAAFEAWLWVIEEEGLKTSTVDLCKG